MLVRSTCVVFDRYYYDLIVDPCRYRFGGPKFAPIVINKFIPKPDLIILLDAPVEILLQRKQEVSFSEAERQRTEYLNLIKKLPSSVVVNSAQPLQNTVSEAIAAITSKMENITNKNIKNI